MRLINQRPDLTAKKQVFKLEEIDMADPRTFALLQSGETTGVFQLEGSGMQELFKNLKPDAFEDIVAAVALYRPGPLGSGMVKDFVDCKHGRKAIEKMHPLVDELLKPTYGVIVYQEQVMQITQHLAGYSLGGADLLRRAMGKKKPEEMAKQKATFVSGAEAKGVKTEDAERIFALLEYFAGYGFNKSHSGRVRRCSPTRPAYLKAHYPVEFLCALMTADRDKIEKVVRIIAEGRAWGIDIPPARDQRVQDRLHRRLRRRPPSDGNGGSAHRRPQGQQAPQRRARPQDPLRPGRHPRRRRLGAPRRARGARRGGGPSRRSLRLRPARRPASRVNKGVFRGAGAGRRLRRPRSCRPRHHPGASAFAAIDRALERSRRASKDREGGQTDIFSLLAKAAPADRLGGGASGLEGYLLCRALGICARPWCASSCRSAFYVVQYPLDRYGVELGRFDEWAPTSAFAAMDPWSKVRVGGHGGGLLGEDLQGRRRQDHAFFILEDQSVGRVEVKVRQNQIETYAHVLTRQRAGADLGQGGA